MKSQANIQNINLTNRYILPLAGIKDVGSQRDGVYQCYLTKDIEENMGEYLFVLTHKMYPKEKMMASPKYFNHEAINIDNVDYIL